MSVIPEDVWSRWTMPEFDQLKQAILVFSGSPKTEIVIEAFPDISLLYQEGEGTNTVKGIFYLTTKRIVFLPKNQIPHNQLVQAEYQSLRTLGGSRNDMTIYMVDSSGGTAIFRVPSTKTLYQCFNLCRKLAEAVRLDSKKFQNEVYQVVTATERDETPFTSIEFDLAQCTKTNEIVQADTGSSQVLDIEDEEKEDPIFEFLNPIKNFLDYCNHLHFDIHIKLRVLFFISLFSFILKFIPFLPLSGLVFAIFILFNTWTALREDKSAMGTFNLDPWRGNPNQGFAKTRLFIREWTMWENPQKTGLLLKVSLAVFFGWCILPPKLYFSFCVISYFVFIIYPLAKSDVIPKIITGFWFST